MFVPKSGTWLYNSTLSSAIRLRVTRAGGGARSVAALYHPLIRCQDYQWRGGSDPNNFSTSAPASSARRFLYYLKLASYLKLDLINSLGYGRIIYTRPTWIRILFPIISPLVYNPEELINEYITLNTTNRNRKNTDKRVITKEKIRKRRISY